MPGQDIKIAASEGGQIDTYLSLPGSGPAPAVIIVPHVFGVDPDTRKGADDLAARGFVVAAFDPFWRGDSGPLPRTEDGQTRAAARAQPRGELIEQGVQDLADVMADLKSRPECNGRIAVIGLCYGGPYAILGPARLGCDAGLSFHGTKVEDYLDDLDKVHVPLSLHWGDQDHAAPPEALERIQAATRDMQNVDITIYPGVLHGYSSPSSEKAWNPEAAEDSWRRAEEIVGKLSDRAGSAAA